MPERMARPPNIDQTIQKPSHRLPMIPSTNPTLARVSPLAGDRPSRISLPSAFPRYQATGPHGGQKTRLRMPGTSAVIARELAGGGGGTAGGDGGMVMAVPASPAPDRGRRREPRLPPSLAD